MFVNYLGKGENKTYDKESINILCDITDPEHYKLLGFEVILSLKTSSQTESIMLAHNARLNIVQNSYFFITLAKYMKSNFKIPYIVLDNRSCSILDLEKNLKSVCDFFKFGKSIQYLINSIVTKEIDLFIPKLLKYRESLRNKKIFLTQDQIGESNQFNNILRQVGLIQTTNLLEADLVLGDDEYENYYIKIGKSFCSINYGKQLGKKGYLGVLELYKKLHLCNKKVEVDSKMYAY